MINKNYCRRIVLIKILVLVPVCRQAFVEKYLEVGHDASKSSVEFTLFVEKFLRPDGVFLLKMISIHAGNIMCSRLTEALWVHYIQWRNAGQVITSTSISMIGVGGTTNQKESFGSSTSALKRRSGCDIERRRSHSRESRPQPIIKPIMNMSGLSENTRHYV